jgi:hypothetical protein
MSAERSTRSLLAMCALVVLATAGCAAPIRVFVNGQADMTLYKKVVMVPFANLSSDPYAGARVTRAFTTELVIADRFQLVDPAQLLGELDRAGTLPDANGQLDPVKLRDAAAKLEATAVIRGAVTEYASRGSGADTYPVVAFDAEMVDAATGNIVWRISVTESGKGRIPIVGGAGERAYGRVTQAACQRAVNELRKKAF